MEDDQVVHEITTSSFHLVSFCPTQEWLDEWARTHSNEEPSQEQIEHDTDVRPVSWITSFDFDEW